MNHKLIVGLVWCCAALMSGGCAGGRAGSGATDAFEVTDSPIEAGSATMIVHGMSCPLCANNVDAQLKEVPGVRDVSIDMATGRVAVAFVQGKHPSTAQLKRAVDGTGFSLKSLSTP